MKRMRSCSFVSLILSFLLLAAGPVYAQSDDITIITNADQLPHDAKSLGKIRSELSLKGFCSYDEAMADLKRRGIKKGANLLFVDYCSIIFPPGKDYCIALRAQAYSIQDPESTKQLISEIPDTISGKEYGYLFLYRGNGFEYPGGKNKIFQVLLDSSQKYTITQGCAYAIRVTPGNHSLSIENSKTALTMNTEAGKAYYIKADADKNTVTVPGQVVLTFGGWSYNIRQIKDNNAGKLDYDVVIGNKN